jgi:hypothetical protein
MRAKLAITGLIIATILLAPLTSTFARGDDFDAVVKAIEQFYHVKHQSLPLLARTGMKGARTVARIKGGDYKRIADAGSVRLVFFEDQEFNSHGRIAGFKASIQNTLDQTWSPLIATLSAKDEEQTYIYISEAGPKFHVLVVTIERREATVVEATLAPDVLATLMKDPGEMGKTLTDDAALNNNQEPTP